nr:hypothetical protein [Tanacetum cinerariifolium]
MELVLEQTQQGTSHEALYYAVEYASNITAWNPTLVSTAKGVYLYCSFDVTTVRTCYEARSIKEYRFNRVVMFYISVAVIVLFDHAVRIQVIVHDDVWAYREFVLPRELSLFCSRIGITSDITWVQKKSGATRLIFLLVYTRYEETELMDAAVIKAAVISRRNKKVADGRHSLVTTRNRYEQEQGASNICSESTTAGKFYDC